MLSIGESMGGRPAELAVWRTWNLRVTAGAEKPALVAVIHVPSENGCSLAGPELLAAAFEAAAGHDAVIVSTTLRDPDRADARRFAAALIDGARRAQLRSHGADPLARLGTADAGPRPTRRRDESTSLEGRPC